MPEVSYKAVIEAPIEVVWEFAKDMKNWAPLLKYYQALEEINERESIWTLKGEIGPFSRTTKLHVTITEWVENKRVAFNLDGINEPVKGSGSADLSSETGEGQPSKPTTVSVTLNASMLGPAGVLMNRLITPMLEPTAKDLVAKFAAAVMETYRKKAK